MGRAKSQGCATGAKAAAKRSEVSREKLVQLRAFGRLTRLATRLRAAEAAIAEALGVLSDRESPAEEARRRAHQILAGVTLESSTTPTFPAPGSAGATAASASSRALR